MIDKPHRWTLPDALTVGVIVMILGGATLVWAHLDDLLFWGLILWSRILG